MSGDRMILLLTKTIALGTDGVQWIVYRGYKPKTPTNRLWNGHLWAPADIYISSQKAVLIDRIVDRGYMTRAICELMLAKLPDTFRAWLAANPHFGPQPEPTPAPAAEPPPRKARETAKSAAMARKTAQAARKTPRRR